MRSFIILISICITLFSCKTITVDSNKVSSSIPDDIELIKIPAGIYTSGENNSARYIYYDYEIMKYPVTNAQYMEFIKDAILLELVTVDTLGVYGEYRGDEFWPSGIYKYIDFSSQNARNGYYPPNYYFTIWRYVENQQESYDNHPVTHVTWFGANAFAKFYGMRLPAVEEWEKAARANSGNDYSWGDTLSPNYANYSDNGDIYDNDTTPVGYFNGYGNTSDSHSPYGIYDMSGNVWEWTSSWWRDTSGKIIRGGSWESNTNNTDVEDMFVWYDLGVGYSVTNVSREIGFRCVVDL